MTTTVPIDDIRLLDFPTKITPLSTDIIYFGDSADNFNERKVTLRQLGKNIPLLLVNSTTGGITSCLFTYSTGTISQSGSTITGAGTAFTSLNITSGQLIVFQSGQTATVLNVVNDTTLKVDTIATIPSGQYTMYYGGFQMDPLGNGSAQNFKSLPNIKIFSSSSNLTTDASNHMYEIDATSGNKTVTLMLASNVSGKEYIFKKSDGTTNDVIINANGGDTIDGSASYTLSGTANPYASVTIVSDGINNWSVIGAY